MPVQVVWGGCAGGRDWPVLHPAADTQAKTHAEGFRSWTLPPMVGSDGGPKTIVVRIPELPSSNPIDPGLSLLKKNPSSLGALGVLAVQPKNRNEFEQEEAERAEVQELITKIGAC